MKDAKVSTFRTWTTVVFWFLGTIVAGGPLYFAWPLLGEIYWLVIAVCWSVLLFYYLLRTRRP